MELGVHLPLLTWDEPRSEPASLIEYVQTAKRLGFTAVSANDHLQYRRPWLDGPTALASVVSATGRWSSRRRSPSPSSVGRSRSRSRSVRSIFSPKAA